MKFSALNVVFATLNLAPLRLGNPPYGGVKLWFISKCMLRPLQRQQKLETGYAI